MASIGVFANILDDQNRVLMVKHGYGKKLWAMPGGALEDRESPPEGVVREVHEETGYHVVVDRLIGAYYIRSTDNLVLSFAANIIHRDEWYPNQEIKEIGFFSSSQLPEPMAFNAKLRIKDAFDGAVGIMRVINKPDEVETYNFFA